MKKLLYSASMLVFAAVSYAQSYSDAVHVIVKNYTDYNLYFAPRYNLGWWDGTNDTTYFGYANTSLGANALTRDLDYQQEGQFEVVSPQTWVEYNNGSSNYPGYPFLINPDASTFDTSGLGMVGYQNEPDWFHKFMKLSWIRFAVSTSSLGSAAYGGALAYGFDPTGMTPVSANHYIDGNNEIFRSYGPSSISFTAYGTTIYAEFIWVPAPINGDPNSVHIVFYQ